MKRRLGVCRCGLPQQLLKAHAMLGYVAVDCPANQTRRCGLEKAGDYRQIEGVIFCGGTAYAVAGCADERMRRPYTLRMPLWAAQRLDSESENGGKRFLQGVSCFLTGLGNCAKLVVVVDVVVVVVVVLVLILVLVLVLLFSQSGSKSIFLL